MSERYKVETEVTVTRGELPRSIMNFFWVVSVVLIGMAIYIVWVTYER